MFLIDIKDIAELELMGLSSKEDTCVKVSTFISNVIYMII